jgi:hypothetical protein
MHIHPEHSHKNEPALEALADFIDQLDIPVTTDEKLASEDREFQPALVDGKEPAPVETMVPKVVLYKSK